MAAGVGRPRIGIPIAVRARGDERDDPHRARAARAGERIHLVDEIGRAHV